MVDLVLSFPRANARGIRRSNKDIGGEVEGLQETVQLVEMAMKPLLDKDENIECQVRISLEFN